MCIVMICSPKKCQYFYFNYNTAKVIKSEIFKSTICKMILHYKILNLKNLQIYLKLIIEEKDFSIQS